MKKFVVFAFVSALTSSPTNAAVVIDIQEVGSDIVANASGTLNLEGLTDNLFSGGSSGIQSGIAVFTTIGNGTVHLFNGITGPANFGTSSNYTFATNFSGDAFFLNGTSGRVAVPADYVSGSPLTFMATFANQSFASLGLTQGAYLFTAPSDTITVNIGQVATAAVPEPSTWLTMILGFGAIGFAMRRRQRQTVRYSFG